MKPYTIDQFLFPYQRSFAHRLRTTARQVFERIGAGMEPQLFLVGIAWPALPGRHIVCIEPEDGPWPQSLFTATPASLDAAWKSDDRQNFFYTDEATMRDKPETIRRLVVSEAILRDLAARARVDGVRNFVSTARPIGGYYVTAVLQAPQALFRKFPSIHYQGGRRLEEGESEGHFLLDCIHGLLREAERGLEAPEPGRFNHDGMRSADEIIRQAAHDFMRIPFVGDRFASGDLFERFNAISRLMYEGAKGRGRMIMAVADDPAIDYVVKLAQPVPLRETRWVRKLLQMGTDDSALIIGEDAIYGLGRHLKRDREPYSVEFLDQQQWDFRKGSALLLRTRFGEPRLPEEPVGEAHFLDNFRRIFRDAPPDNAERFRTILDHLLAQPRGSMLVVAEDAASEAARLEQQATLIEPTLLTQRLIDRASRIDGSILADPDGLCHAIGVILDGAASDACLPSRGARYNSAIRYVDHQTARRLAFVISEDRTLDIIPLLRPRRSAAALKALVGLLEAATIDNYHAPRNALDEARFYLDADQCARINAVLARLDAQAMNEGQLVWRASVFAPDPAMNEDYLQP